MWVLECDGDVLGQKKLWLKPGQKYLFGRTKVETSPGEHSYAISNKSVSRKHLVIAVAPVVSGKGGELFDRSRVDISDESKIGTHLDGVRFNNDTREITNREQTIRLGSFNQIFKLSWQPVVLTFSFTDKEQKRATDILAPFRRKLEPLDIKTIIPYDITQTTHVITSKRNIAKGLQALVNAKFIVTDAFVDALVTACTSPGLAEDGVTPLPSPVEVDSVGNWPDAMQFLPPSGKEPTPRPPELFAPDVERISLFEGLTFVFADETQWDQLQPVVTNGGAKAVKYDLRLGVTTLEEFVQYVRNVAEQKGMERFGDDENGKAVVVVRFRGKGDTEQWAIDFLERLDQELEQRSVEQNEFLDAILTKDARPLKRGLQDETQPRVPSSTSVSTPPVHSHDSARSDVPEPLQDRNQESLQEVAPAKTERSSPQKSTRRRIPITTSRFKGFDDFDASKLPKIERKPDAPVATSGEVEAMEVEPQSLFVPETRKGTNAQSDSVTTRKRSHTEVSEDQNASAAMVDNLLPATAAMKKRRLEDAKAGRTRTRASGSAEPGDTQQEKGTTKKPAKKEVNVRQAAKSHAEQLDAQRSGNVGEAMDDTKEIDDDGKNEIAQLKDLAIVEDMEVPERRDRRGQSRRQDEDGPVGHNKQWDERWNGMKNFKGFRRQGDRSNVAGNQGRKILVGLEEVKKKDFGLGESYWLESTGSRNGRREQQQTESPAQRRERENEENEVVIPEEVAGQPREGPIADALATQSLSQKANTRKRNGESGNAPPPKRTRQSRLGPPPVDDESSDEDELKFRFRRKKI